MNNKKPSPPDDFKLLGPRVETAEPLRLDRFLALRYPFLSRSEWKKRILEKKVWVDHAFARADAPVKGGEQIFFHHPPSDEPEVEGELRIIGEKAGVLAVNKPPGLPMHEGGPYRLNTLAHRLKLLTQDHWAAAHRIDRETSGLVLCAKDERPRSALGKGFRDNLIEKYYLAIINGVPKDPYFVVDDPIGELNDSQIRIKNWINYDTGQTALTRFWVLAQIDKQHSLVLASPKTGRTNQIRIHLASRGHPLVGDKLFHPDEGVFLDYWENGMSERIAQKTGHYRCALHAWKAKIPESLLNEPIEFTAAFPEDLKLWMLQRAPQLFVNFK